MSDTFPKQRAFPGSLDARPRDGNAAATGSADPLAELARLVGRDDPFKDLFAARKPARPERIEPPAPPPPMLPDPEPFDRFSPQADHRSASDHLFGEGGLDHPDDRRGAAEDDRVFHAPLGQAHPESFRLPAMTAGHARHGDPHAATGEAPPLNADLWAQGMPEPVSSEPLHYAPGMDEAEAAEGGHRKRTLLVLAAVVALTAGGLGATFLVRGGSTGTGSGEPPTILADTGPAKIQPPDTSNQATGGDGTTALIEKSASDNVNNAKVVNTQERPVDLSQLPSAPDAAAAPTDGRVAVTTTSGGAAAASVFPEPRKVKTVMVRPDGSLVGDDAGQGAAASPAATAPAAAVPKPATPKSTARATATPKPAAAATDSAPVKPKPVAHAKPKPATQTADAAPTADAAAAEQPTATATPAATGAAGSFAVQLAAPPTEQEAKDISSRLQKKFASELDGHAPSIRKADNKSVYRVRVSNLSKDDAAALCDKLKAGGGSCFVVHN